VQRLRRLNQDVATLKSGESKPSGTDIAYVPAGSLLRV